MELGICCVHLHKGAASFKYRNQHIFEHGYHKYNCHNGTFVTAADSRHRTGLLLERPLLQLLFGCPAGCSCSPVLGVAHNTRYVAYVSSLENILATFNRVGMPTAL